MKPFGGSDSWRRIFLKLWNFSYNLRFMELFYFSYLIQQKISLISERDFYILVVGPPGLEPGTNRLWADCSNHWAIGPFFEFWNMPRGWGIWSLLWPWPASPRYRYMLFIAYTEHNSDSHPINLGTWNMAVDEGFEPSRRLATPYRFSKPASSATWVTHHEYEDDVFRNLVLVLQV